MKTSAVVAAAIWGLIVGGNVVDVLIIPPRTFLDGPQLPWPIVFLPPLVVVVGAYLRRGIPGELTIGRWIDRQFGVGSYRELWSTFRPELLFAAMCLGIVLSGMARAFLFNTPVLPPWVTGFFASGGLAFLAAHYIRRRRESHRPPA